MKPILATVLTLLSIVCIAAIAFLWTPVPQGFDRTAAVNAAASYNARIIRDGHGVPHIYGARDPDVAFGLGYAHAEDDWETFEDVLWFSRGVLSEHRGRNGAIPDFLVGALNVMSDVDAKYEHDLTDKTIALAEGYAAGLNLFCVDHPDRCSKGTAPVTGKDIVAGFLSRTPFFYGLDDELTKLFEGNIRLQSAARKAREAFVKAPLEARFGSNAMTVSGARSADGATRLMVNSHQPYEGPVAWYEARVKSEEGWDMIGGLFPGAPLILLGAGPKLGWAHTVNKPDLVDFFKLQVDDDTDPKKYYLDGEWRPLPVRKVTFRVKLFWRFSLPVTRRVYDSVFGPAFITEKGVFAVSYGGAGNIKAIEQWYGMNRAKTFDEWRAAMEIGGIPSFNTIYADREGTTAYYYNAAIPLRDPETDWSSAVEGTSTKLQWQGVRPLSEVPKVINPSSGLLINGNNKPFAVSALEDSPDQAAFPPHLGIDLNETNRGFRLQELYGADQSITEEEFLRYKFDDVYAGQSKTMKLARMLAELPAVKNDSTLSEAASLLRGWDGSVSVNSNSAALAILTAQEVHGFLLNRESPGEEAAVTALKTVATKLMEGFGRIDPPWGEVVRLKRGSVDLAIDGGPDTLRAVYPIGDPADGPLKAAFGDSYILYAEWNPEGEVNIHTIHQYGAATMVKASPFYDDQAPIFAREEWKKPPMSLDLLLVEATADYRPGRVHHTDD